MVTDTPRKRRHGVQEHPAQRAPGVDRRPDIKGQVPVIGPRENVADDQRAEGPAYVPQVFIAPERVPENLPPRSMVAPQAWGIAISPPKLAIAMVSTAKKGS